MNIRKEIVLILFILIGYGTKVSAQKFWDKNFINLSVYDQKVVHLGFYIGTGAFDYKYNLYQSIADNPYYLEALANSKFPETMPVYTPLDPVTNPIYIDTEQLTPGLSLGIVTAYKLTENLDIRFIPGIELGSRKINFNIPLEYPNGTVQDTATVINVKSTYANIPLLLKYKGNRHNNIRPYIVFGGSIKYDFEKGAEESLMFKTKPLIYALDFGLGLDNYTQFFMFNIELRYSMGLNNVIDYSYDKDILDIPHYSYPVQALRAQTVSLILYFE